MPESDPHYSSASAEPESHQSMISENKGATHMGKRVVNMSNKHAKLLVLAILIVVIIGGLVAVYGDNSAPLKGIVGTDEINISSETTSRVSELLVNKGDSVKEGQTVAFMADPHASLDTLQAAHKPEHTKGAEDRDDSDKQEQNVRILKSQWLSAQLNEYLASISVDRAIKLNRNGDQSTLSFDEAKARLDVAREQSRSLHRQYWHALYHEQEQYAASSKPLESTQSSAQWINVTAPVDGEVVKRFAHRGELMGAGVPLFSMIDLNNLWVTIKLRKDGRDLLKMGDTIIGRIPALDDKHVHFKVTLIRPQRGADSQRASWQNNAHHARTFNIRLRSLEAVDGLRPGMTVLYDWPPCYG